MKMLFSAYRLDQYPDPDGFMAQTALILSEYPAEVVTYVTDPRTGIQRQQKFPPTVSEISAACDARTAAIQRQKDLDAWSERKRKSDELRARQTAMREIVIPGQITYREFLARCEASGANPRPIGIFETVKVKAKDSRGA
jgi:hypothetical protein